MKKDRTAKTDGECIMEYFSAHVGKDEQTKEEVKEELKERDWTVDHLGGPESVPTWTYRGNGRRK